MSSFLTFGTDGNDNLMKSNAGLSNLLSENIIDSFDDLLQFPKYVQIETVSTCNARCIMCPVEDWKREHTVMEQATFDKIVDEIRNYNDWIERVTIQLDGEPLMDRDLEVRIKQLKSAGIRLVAFASNGSLMTKRRAHSIINSGVDEVSFSVDGASKVTFEKIRVRLNFEKVVKNILDFIDVRDQLNADTVVRIRMTIQPENENEFDEFMDFWQTRIGSQDSVYGKVLHTWGNSDNLFTEAKGYDFPRLNRTPCSSPWTSLIILTDGRIPLCCCDYNASIELGNVRDRNIKDLWQGNKFNRIRDVHAKYGRKAIPMCVNCTVWDDDAKQGD